MAFGHLSPCGCRGGGPAKSPSEGFVDPGSGLPVPVGRDADSMQEAEDFDDEAVADRRQARMRHDPRGVPESWKDEIEDIEVCFAALRHWNANSADFEPSYTAEYNLSQTPARMRLKKLRFAVLC